MSFRELTMIDVKEVLRRWQAGQSARQMSREGVVGRRTATRYIDAAKELGLDSASELTDEVVRAVAHAVQDRPTPEPSEVRRILDQHRARIEQWLEQDPPLTLVRVQELLARDGVSLAYTSLRRYAHDELGWKERGPTVLIDDPPPGEQAQIDFGEVGHVKTAEGKRRKLWVLIVTLPMSRYQFVWPTFRQTVEALRGARRCLALLWWRREASGARQHERRGRACGREGSGYAPARGFFVDPARVRHPQDKARVENQVPYVRERWFAGESFSDDLAMLRESAERWCVEVAGARIHGTTRRVPREVFEAEERAHLGPAPTAPFDAPRWTRAKVHPDHHVQVAYALYSVPTRYRGQRMRVRVDQKTVGIYAGNDLVKMHPRVGPGKRSTDTADYPVGTAPYARRSVDGIIAKGREHGEHVGIYAERLLAGPLPWTRMRQADGLLRLCERYGAGRVDALCARALAFDVLDVPRIERMLKAARTAEDTAPKGTVVPLPRSRFARDPSSFATIKRSPKGGA
jgi:hypothetical protein